MASFRVVVSKLVSKPNRAPIRDHALEFMAEDEAAHLEESLWWMVGRRAVLARLLDRAQAMRNLGKIVEIGCGSGGDLPVLSSYGEVVAIERSPLLAGRARARGLAREVVEADFFDLELDSGVDLYCLFDVLEHIEDDAAFIRRLEQHSDPGQLLLISVPACPWLFSRHDTLLHHHRRYTRRGLDELLDRSGFEVQFSSYFLFFAFPAVVLARLREKWLERIGRASNEVSLGAVPAWASHILTCVMRFEAWLLGYLRFPIGVWAFSLARRRD